MYSQNYFQICHKFVNGYYVYINDFDYNIAEKYLIWFHGKNKVERVLNDFFDKSKVRPSKAVNIYEVIVPSLFFKSANINNDLFNSKMFSPDNIDYSLVSIFDEVHFVKLLDYWKSEYKINLHKELLSHLSQNYQKYINEATIKNIIE